MQTVAAKLRTGAGDARPALRSTQLEVAHQLGLDGAKPGKTKAPIPDPCCSWAGPI